MDEPSRSIIQDQIFQYKSVLKSLMVGRRVEVRGQKYRESVPRVLTFAPMPRMFFESFSQFSQYLAHARVEYIIEALLEPEIPGMMKLFAKDMLTRQAVVYRPDWEWRGKDFGHLNCILAYQFMFREDQMDLHIFMRSSDAWNAFLIDYYTASRHLEWFSDRVYKDLITPLKLAERESSVATKESSSNERVAMGQLYFHISNMHIREQDVKIIEEWLK